MWIRNVVSVIVCVLLFALLAGTIFEDLEHKRGNAIVVPTSPESNTDATVDAVNREFKNLWASQGLTPSGRADDLTIIRRLSLGLTGTIPSFEELRELESVPREQRLDWWLAYLLQDRRYADYVAERLARSYVGTENGPFIVYRRRRFVDWLSNQLHQNTPYDQLVRHLISDQGIWTSSPAVNFVTVTVRQAQGRGPDPIRLAGRTSRAFLGMRIDCLQCHDDQFGKTLLGDPDLPHPGEQEDFHQLAAFFSEAQMSIIGVDDKPGRPYQYKYRHTDEDQVVPCVPPYATQLMGEEGSRRKRLARWVTHAENKPFARAMVNRVWALLFGRPLADSIDDIPLYGELPTGMETLATGFVQHAFNIRWLIQAIAHCEPFQRSSRASFRITGEHESNWAVFPLTRLRPEQVSGSLIQAANLRTIDADSHILVKLARFGQQRDFVKRYGDSGEDEFEPRAGTITQRLLMMNGNLVKEKTKPEPLATAAARIATLAPDNATAIRSAYMATLTRAPTQSELDHFVARLEEHASNQAKQRCMEDIYWALVNSSEFCWNH